MTVYVWRNVARKPRIRHLPDPRAPHPDVSLCRQRIDSAEGHAARRVIYALDPWGLTPIDYDLLPLCAKCVKARTK